MSIVEGSKENPLPDPTNKKLRIKGAWYLHKLGLRFWDGKKINKPKENRPPKKNRTPKEKKQLLKQQCEWYHKTNRYSLIKKAQKLNISVRDLRRAQEGGRKKSAAEQFKNKKLYRKNLESIYKKMDIIKNKIKIEKNKKLLEKLKKELNLLKREKKKLYMHNYRKINNKNRNIKYKLNPQLKIKSSMAGRIRSALKLQGASKNKRTLEYVNCSVAHVYKYIESLFTDGMSWDNYGLGDDKWHLDHRRPCASFGLNDVYNQCGNQKILVKVTILTQKHFVINGWVKKRAGSV